MPRKLFPLLFLAVCGVGVWGLWPQLYLKPASYFADMGKVGALRSVNHDYMASRLKLRNLEDAQAKAGEKVFSDQAVEPYISSVDFDLEASDASQAKIDVVKLNDEIVIWQKQLDARIQAKAAAAAAANSSQPLAPGFGLQVPIMIYHYTPSDFENQLQTLIAKGYTSIDLDQLAAGLHHQGTLPAKPIVITFDDGFSNQMQAYALLRKYNFKATYYIIDGGPISHYCIGAGRRYDQSPPCGDGYLNWDDVRELDRSGLITIAAHTIDHLALASQSLDVMRSQIFDGKAQLEAQIGHPVRHFAYPYGSFSASVIQLVREAGFITAVSTLPGTIQTPDSIYSLHRSRSVYTLP